MKKMMLGMMALCAATAFGDMKIGTVDMMVLVRNHKSYDTNKKMLQDSEKDYQKELDSMKAELDALQDEGKKVADQARNPMISQSQKDKIEKELLDIQNKYVAGQQKLRTHQEVARRHRRHPQEDGHRPEVRQGQGEG